MRAYRKSDATQVAQAALELATRLPELVYRNLGKVEQAWQQMRADRAAFVEYFGRDELVLLPGEAEERINSFYRHRQAALARPPARRPPNIPAWTCPRSSFRPNSRRWHDRRSLRRDRRAQLL